MITKTAENRNLVADKLSSICGHAGVTTDQEGMFNLGFSQTAMPELVVRPGTIEEIGEIVSFAMGSGTSIIPVGGGTQIRQVLTDSQAGIGLCMDRLSRVHEFALGNFSITAEAGTLHSTIQEMVNAKNLQLPVAADFTASTIGGEVATNFSSRKRYKFGTVGDYVLGLTYITPTGKFVKTGGQTVKNASGYDFTKLLGGSWGTMGILTSVTLRLNPLPEREVLLVRDFTGIGDAVEEGIKFLSRKPDISGCNIFNKPGSEETSVTMSISLEGSRELIDSQLKLLSPSASWSLLEEEVVFKSAEASHLNMRRATKKTYFNTVILDKRAIWEFQKCLHFLIQQGCLLDFDIAAGVLEFSIPKDTSAPFGLFWNQWNLLIEELNGQAVTFSPNGSNQPLLDRLLPTIDPHKIMFRNNIFSRRYHLG